MRYGSRLDAEISARCLATTRVIERARLPGVLDVVPSFATVAVHYQPSSVSDTPYRTLRAAVAALLESRPFVSVAAAHTVRVPVCYDDAFAMDMAYVASASGLTRRQIIDLHTSDRVTVFALGFAPGLPYIGVHDERFDLPRRATPRTVVPAGSVAIANRQSVIYPNAGPGGWHVIGAVPVPLFDPDKAPHTLLAPGDAVRFVAVTRRKFDALREEVRGH